MMKRAPVEEVFGEVLKELRTRTGKTQEGLALDAGLDRTYISLLERALRQPTLETVLRLAPALNVLASEIVAMVELRVRL